MEISAALGADLKSLTEALDQPGVDFEAMIRRLADDTRAAVSSYLGLSIRVVADGYPVVLRMMDEFTDSADITTSARLPMSAVCAGEPAGMIVFYAATPGAFVDFGADLGYALGRATGTVVLDADLAPLADAPVTGLREVSRLNQAIGILIADGHDREDARGELQRLAQDAQIPIQQAAQHLIRSIRRRSGPEPA